MNKESYAYYKKSYRANKRYQDKIGNDEYAPMLTQKEFAEIKDSGISNKDLVYNQFHFYTRDQAEKIKRSLEQEGFKISKKNVQARNYTDAMYDRMGEIYHQLREDFNAADAASLIANAFYGS